MALADEVNPFAEKSGKGKGSEKAGFGRGGFFSSNDEAEISTLSPLPPEPYDRSATMEISLDNARDLTTKEKELDAREAELRRREQEVNRKQKALEEGNETDVKNWPAFWPIIHHDIPNDIPVHSQKLQYLAFTTLLGLIVCLVWNITALTVGWIFVGGLGGNGLASFYGLMYLIFGTLGAYWLWYSPLYKAMRSDSALRFGVFFFVYAIHIAFCAYAAVAPPVYADAASFVGAFAAFRVLNVGKGVAILFFIGFALWACEATLSVFVMQQIIKFFRGAGKAAQAKKEVASAAMMKALE